MLIKILSVANEDKGKYNQLTVQFRHLGTGQVMATKLMSFTNPDVFSTMKKAEVDSVWDVHSEKNEKDFWEWKNVSPSTDAGESEQASKSKRAPAIKANSAGRDFESKDERALRQVLIVRQSSITAALQLPHPKGLDDVLATAAKIETWVFRGKDAQRKLSEGVKTIAEMDDDIPY